MLAVTHKEFGEGYAVCFREKAGRTFIVVDFGEIKKEFPYPDAFADELRANDPEVQSDILSEMEK